MTSVHVVLPNDIDDPATPSGGNAYDRRICDGLAASGWSVHEHAVRGAWPRPSAPERADLARVLRAIPDNAVVLLDGLVASAVPDVLVPQARRLHLIVLVHMPLGETGRAQPEPGVGGGEHAPSHTAEGDALAAACAVITTSAWTRRRLLDLYALPADRIHVATPGVDRAPLAPGSDAGSELLCVAAVTPHKGHDLLTHALAMVADLPWNCVCVGSLSRDPEFVERLRRQTREHGLDGRVRLVGPRTGDGLDAAYAAADLLVLASRGETYGMVVTEALARGIPVLATAANGLPEALGRAADGTLPGMLVEPGEPVALAAALRRWLTNAELRQQLRQAARGRRTTLTGWATTAALISGFLHGVPANSGGPA
jgi:glycosyltransferase involved in cell wall biosynthesis